MSTETEHETGSSLNFCRQPDCLKVYFQSDQAKECRAVVQKMNVPDERSDPDPEITEPGYEEYCADDEQRALKRLRAENKELSSRWSKYIEE
jgi:hypothetical protein